MNIVEEFYRFVLQGNLDLFAGGSELRLLRFLCERTLRFGKYSEYVPNQQICKTGVFVVGTSPLCWSRDMLKKCRLGLSKRGLITYTFAGGSHHYSINLPGMWKVIQVLYGGAGIVRWDHYVQFFTNISNEFRAEGIPHDVKVTVVRKRFLEIQDAIQGGIIQSTEAVERKAKKLEAKDPRRWSPDDVRAIIKRYCEEHDVPCNDRGFTGRDAGCAKNFVKYCLEAELDPKQILYDSIRRYHEYRITLKLSNGAPLTLPIAFDFQEFFRHRAQIMDYLITEEREYERTERTDNWQVTDLGIDPKEEEDL